MSGLRVAVVGAGIAGLSVAAFLARTGTASGVYEQAAAPGEVGAGIQLSPNGSRLLHRIGLAGHLARTAVRPEAIEVRHWQSGAILACIELGAACEAHFGAPYYTMHRTRLHRGLLGLATGTVHCGQRCVGVAEYADRVELRFADGSATEADLVIGADGLHSVVRQVLVADGIRYSGLVAHRGLVRADRLPWASAPPKVLVWIGSDRHVVCYPISAGWLNLVAVLPGPAEPGRGSAAQLPSSFPAWHKAVRALVTEVGPTTRWPLYDRGPLPRWHSRRIVVVGDAAHPLLPFAAQGANQAIEDAAALAACLRIAADLTDALSRYERLRVPRLARVSALVRDNVGNPQQPDGAAWLYGYDAERVAEGEHDGHSADPPVPDADRGRPPSERAFLATRSSPGRAADP